jgi:hypothetical protein
VTIAACYISPEGVVLGADSTSTYGSPRDPHYYNNAQKLFEIGEGGTLGVVTWGIGGLQVSSHRTLLALFADDLKDNPPVTVSEAATRWRDRFWAAYSDPACPIAPLIAKCKALAAKAPYDAAVAPNAGMRTKDEDEEYKRLHPNLVAGFCLAGYLLPDRVPMAFQIVFDPLQGAPVPLARPSGYWFWGAPNMIQRLIFACDDDTRDAIEKSGFWKGTRADLDAAIAPHVLAHPIVPIRDAIDFVHACISSTIKAFKFSSLAQICGGPIELAVITTDRKFRWVWHKPWDAAIKEGDA